MAVENLQSGDSYLWSIFLEDGYDEGIVPVPNDTDTLEIVRLHQPVETLIVRFEMRRHGGPPKMPSKVSLDTNLVFLRGSRGRATVIQDAAGVGHEWSCNGVYVYVKLKSVGLDADMPMSKVPWDATDVSDYTVPKSYFQTDLIGVPPTSKPSFTPWVG